MLLVLILQWLKKKGEAPDRVLRFSWNIVSTPSLSRSIMWRGIGFINNRWPGHSTVPGAGIVSGIHERAGTEDCIHIIHDQTHTPCQAHTGSGLTSSRGKKARSLLGRGPFSCRKWRLSMHHQFWSNLSLHFLFKYFTVSATDLHYLLYIYCDTYDN